VTASVWFPDAFSGVPVGAVERLTRTARVHDRHGYCCLWISSGDLSISCVRCGIPGALLIGHSGQYDLARHTVHNGPDGTEHQALWTPHTCTGGPA
jgi:hypothetical protein